MTDYKALAEECRDLAKNGAGGSLTKTALLKAAEALDRKGALQFGTKSVLQDWVMELPLRQQGVLILALRGPDGTRKESEAKPIIRTLRACTMNSGREGRPMDLGQRFVGDAFMRMDLIANPVSWQATMDGFYSSIDEHNIHFLQHLLHAAAVLGFNHPTEEVAWCWLAFYHRGVEKLHMLPESKEQFTYRLRDGDRGQDDAA